MVSNLSIRRSVTHPAVALFCVAVAQFVGCPPAGAQSLSGAPVIFRSGAWAVHRTHDAMTDANICTAIYRNDSNIQLGSHSLVIAIADGLKSVTLRFDDDSAREMRLPKRSERAVDAINIEGADFQRVQQSNRLRYRVLTGNDRVINGDLDLRGANEALRNIQAGCLGEPIG